MTAWASNRGAGSCVARATDHAHAACPPRCAVNVWLDTYRLENAFNLKQAVFCAARDAGFVVLVVTPRYLL